MDGRNVVESLQFSCPKAPRVSARLTSAANAEASGLVSLVRPGLSVQNPDAEASGLSSWVAGAPDVKATRPQPQPGSGLPVQDPNAHAARLSAWSPVSSDVEAAGVPDVRLSTRLIWLYLQAQ